MSRITPVISVVLLVACASESFNPQPYELASGAAVRITVPAGPHRSGILVPLSVQNQGHFKYTWNPCVRSLERLVDDRWVRMPGDPDRWCTLEGWILDPGDRAEARTDIPAGLPPGQYRFHYSFGREGGDFNVTDDQVSNTFTVSP
jgi:hypothetical protein